MTIVKLSSPARRRRLIFNKWHQWRQNFNHHSPRIQISRINKFHNSSNYWLSDRSLSWIEKGNNGEKAPSNHYFAKNCDFFHSAKNVSPRDSRAGSLQMLGCLGWWCSRWSSRHGWPRSSTGTCPPSWRAPGPSQKVGCTPPWTAESQTWPLSPGEDCFISYIGKGSTKKKRFLSGIGRIS